jgi:hypothetical protein
VGGIEALGPHRVLRCYKQHKDGLRLRFWVLQKVLLMCNTGATGSEGRGRLPTTGLGGERGWCVQVLEAVPPSQAAFYRVILHRKAVPKPVPRAYRGRNKTMVPGFRWGD